MADTRFFLRLFSAPALFPSQDGGAAEAGDALLPPGKPLAVLVYLAVEARSVPRSELVELLWPGVDDAHGKGSLRQALWSLRKALDPEVFASDDPLELTPGRVEADLDRFREHVGAGALDEAGRIWTGGLLEGLEFPGARAWRRWVDDLRDAEERRFADALALAAEEARAKADPRSARRWVELAVQVQPYNPRLRTDLIEALLDARAFQAAHEALADARSVLDDSTDGEELAALGERLAALRTEAGQEAESLSLRTEFVGRTAEFSALAAGWRRAKGGKGEVALVLGGPGIGKTRLVQELLALVRSESVPAVAVKAVEAERGLRWGTASELVRALHALPGAAGISNRSASVLSRLVPSLGTFRDEGRGGAPGSVEAAAVTNALLDLATAVADEGPLLVFVDDLQWVDRESRALLSHLARNLAREPVLLVISCRTGDQDPEVAKALESLVRLEGTHRIELSPLGPQEVSELLALLLDDVEPEEVDALGHRIHAITRGNPLFVVEILKLLHQEGLLTPGERGKWTLHPSCFEGKLPVPEDVESAIHRRLEDLGDHAELLAIQMARQARPMPPEELGRLSGLDPFQVSEAVRELFDLDLIRRDAHGRMGFVHDAVTEVARMRLRSPGWSRKAREAEPAGRGRNWVPWAVAGAAVAALAFAGLGGVGPLGFLGGDGGGGSGGAGPGAGGVATAPDHPYGRGRMLVLVVDTTLAYWVTPPREPGGEWMVKDTMLGVSLPGVEGVYRLPSDSLLWFLRESDDDQDKPYVAVLTPDDSVVSFWETSGDAGFRDLSPDGQTVLLWQERLSSPDWYAHDLMVVDRATKRGRPLLEAPERTRWVNWSPDGLKIAATLRAEQDSIHILTSRGAETFVTAIGDYPDIPRISWCSDSQHLAFLAQTDSTAATGILDISTGESVFRTPAGATAHEVLCLGAGTGLAVLGSVESRETLLFQSIATGAVEVILPPEEPNPLGRILWVKDHALPVVQDLSIEPANPTVRWGDEIQLSARGEFSDSTVQLLDVTWEALDPNRASVDQEGRVSGNQAGPAPVVARYGTWLSDTVTVMVEEWARPDVALKGDFQAEALSNWDPFGYPPSRVVEVDGEPVLALKGDGSWVDGLKSREEFSLEDGGRVEVIFRMELTRTDRQRINLCIQRTDVEGPTGDDANLGKATELAYCLQYPRGEQVKHDPTVLSASYRPVGGGEAVHLPADFDTASWTRFALEIQPDGRVALYVNQELLQILDTPIPLRPGDKWRILLAGASVDTDLYVRSLTVYTGTGTRLGIGTQ